MVKISPSILSADFSLLKEEIEFIDKSLAQYVHMDIMDGHFVPNISFGPVVYSSLRSLTKKVFDVHLMIEKPSLYLEMVIDAGADIVGIHREIEEDIISNFKYIKKRERKTTLVYKPETAINDVEEYFPYVDQILLMSVSPGFSGQTFMQPVFKKIESLHKLLESRNLRHKIDISVDGGINLDLGKDCIRAGANVLILGNAIFSKKIQERYELIKQLVNFNP